MKTMRPRHPYAAPCSLEKPAVPGIGRSRSIATPVIVPLRAFLAALYGGLWKLSISRIASKVFFPTGESLHQNDSSRTGGWSRAASKRAGVRGGSARAVSAGVEIGAGTYSGRVLSDHRLPSRLRAGDVARDADRAGRRRGRPWPPPTVRGGRDPIGAGMLGGHRWPVRQASGALPARAARAPSSVRRPAGGSHARGHRPRGRDERRYGRPLPAAVSHTLAGERPRPDQARDAAQGPGAGPDLRRLG